jgi:hypothetical protein
MDGAYSPRSPPYTSPRNTQDTISTDLVHPRDSGMTSYTWPVSKVDCSGGRAPSCTHCGFKPTGGPLVAAVFGSPTWFRTPTPHAARPTSPLVGITWWFEQHGGPRIIRFCRYACLEQARKDRWDAELSEELAQSFAAI